MNYYRAELVVCFPKRVKKTPEASSKVPAWADDCEVSFRLCATDFDQAVGVAHHEFTRFCDYYATEATLNSIELQVLSSEFSEHYEKFPHTEEPGVVEYEDVTFHAEKASPGSQGCGLFLLITGAVVFFFSMHFYYEPIPHLIAGGSAIAAVLGCAINWRLRREAKRMPASGLLPQPADRVTPAPEEKDVRQTQN